MEQSEKFSSRSPVSQRYLKASSLINKPRTAEPFILLPSEILPSLDACAFDSQVTLCWTRIDARYVGLPLYSG